MTLDFGKMRVLHILKKICYKKSVQNDFSSPNSDPFRYKLRFGGSVYVKTSGFHWIQGRDFWRKKYRSQNVEEILFKNNCNDFYKFKVNFC